MFLDKDGTLIPNIPYNVDPSLIEWAPGTAEGLQRLHNAGYRLIVITNQAGVARGYFQEADLMGVEERLQEMMAELGIPLAGFYYCPHHVDGVVPEYAIACDCRKPEPGMLLRAITEHNVDSSRSWYVGDILNDVEAGRRAGCRTVMVDTGGETEWILSRDRLPHHLCKDLAEAARIITAVDQTEPEAS